MAAAPGWKGRGAATNPRNRFERLHTEPDPELEAALGPDGMPAPRTLYLRDTSRSVVSSNASPDVGFHFSVNPYRGCEHACSYCYARPSHEYLGFSAGLDFETRILVKEDAPALLAQKLASSRWEPSVVALSGVTDPYQPVERKLEITRGCLQVLLDHRNPVSVITKNRLVLRDLDLLEALAGFRAAVVNVSITSLEPDLQRVLEPRTSAPRLRLEAIARLRERGIPAGVMVAPVIPGLNDHEIPAILAAAAEAGAGHAGMILLRLPYAVSELFEDWLERHVPERRHKVLQRIRDVRGGRLNDPRFGSRMKGTGPYAAQLRQLFRTARRRAGLGEAPPHLSVEHFRRPGRIQLSLFD